MTDPDIYTSRRRAVRTAEPSQDRTPDPVGYASCEWRKAERATLHAADLIARWRAKLVPRAPGWTRSAGDTSASAENHARKVDVDTVHVFDESDEAQVKREAADENGRRYDARLATMPRGDAWRAMEAAVAGLGGDTSMDTASLIGKALLRDELRGAIQSREADRRDHGSCMRCGRAEPAPLASRCEVCIKRDTKGDDPGELAEAMERLRKGGMLAVRCAKLGMLPWRAAVVAWTGIVVKDGAK